MNANNIHTTSISGIQFSYNTTTGMVTSSQNWHGLILWANSCIPGVVKIGTDYYYKNGIKC